jgi:hypothetical protein
MEMSYFSNIVLNNITNYRKHHEKQMRIRLKKLNILVIPQKEKAHGPKQHAL